MKSFALLGVPGNKGSMKNFNSDLLITLIERF